MGVFFDKASGDAYVSSKLISGTLLNSSFNNGLYTFETTANAQVDSFYMASMFAVGTYYEDLNGLITTYGANAFDGCTNGNIKLGNGAIFGGNAFSATQNSTIEIGNFRATNNNTFGISASNNTFNLKGTIGITTNNNFIFNLDLAGNGNIINTILANQTSGAGSNIEGDLLYLLTSGGTVNFTL